MTHSLRYGPFLSTKIDGKGSRTYSSWFLPERRHASACTSCGPVSVCLSVCLLQVGVLLKRINEPSRSLARELPYSIYYTREKVQLPPEIKVTSLCNVCSKLWTWGKFRHHGVSIVSKRVSVAQLEKDGDAPSELAMA